MLPVGAAALHRVERHHGGKGRYRAGVVLHHVAAQFKRLVVAMAGHVHGATHRVQGDLRRLEVAIRPALAEVGDRGHNQAWVAGVQFVDVQPQARQGARAEVFHQHVGALGQA